LNDPLHERAPYPTARSMTVISALSPVNPASPPVIPAKAGIHCGAGFPHVRRLRPSWSGIKRLASVVYRYSLSPLTRFRSARMQSWSTILEYGGKQQGALR